MNWKSLLNKERLGRPDPGAGEVRTAFQKDFDRIIFSSSFRRLQDKTQVFPLAQNDYVRTRLTHTLEVSSVGRSLGTLAGQGISYALDEAGVNPEQVGALVAAACLAHDIGNPPFGHVGEKAIGQWFRETEPGRIILERLAAEGSSGLDFELFEGNAQGFRVLTRLESPENPGGLQLTYATLATFTKYPRGSQYPSEKGVMSLKKHGFFDYDEELFREVAEKTGLLARKKVDGHRAYHRHPLAFLVEGADDICYYVVDMEDAYRMGVVEGSVVKDYLLRILPGETEENVVKRCGDRVETQIEYLRAKSIGELVYRAVDAFIEHQDDILAGKLEKPLLHLVPQAKTVREIEEFSAANIYPTREVVLIEAAGFNVLGHLLELFLLAIDEMAEKGKKKTSAKSKTFYKLFPQHFLTRYGCPLEETTLYQRVLAVTDFVSSLTDRHAVSLFKRLTGIYLPGIGGL